MAASHLRQSYSSEGDTSHRLEFGLETRNSPEAMNQRKAFSLVEIVVVVMILGILAAIAMPQVRRLTVRADETSVEYSAKVVRDAIEMYTTVNQGRLPGDAGTPEDFLDDLRPFVRTFPTNTIMKSSAVRVQTTGKPLSESLGGSEGWLYDNQTGEFIANLPKAPPGPTASPVEGVLPMTP